MLAKKDMTLLAAEIKAELAKLEKLMHKLAGQHVDMESEELTESTALRLHNFYTGCERIFKLIATEINGGLPQDEAWHKRLLTQVALEVPSIRPAVISETTREQLHALLAFRHVVRNVDGYELEPERVAALQKLAVEVFRQFAKEVETFVLYLLESYSGFRLGTRADENGIISDVAKPVSSCTGFVYLSPPPSNSLLFDSKSLYSSRCERHGLR